MKFIKCVVRRMLYVALAMLPTTVYGEDVTTLFCRPNNGAEWVGRIDIDFTGRVIAWADEAYTITYLDDLYIVAVTNGENSIGATTLLIERDTGYFVRAGVGRFCQQGDCNKVTTGNFNDSGTCRAQSF